MGNMYVNYTLRGVTQRAVADALSGRACIVTPAVNDTVVAFDEESEKQDVRVISSLASRLSRELFCRVLAVLNHGDDILWYQLYVNGELVGGCDIVLDMHRSGELKKLLSEAGATSQA